MEDKEINSETDFQEIQLEILELMSKDELEELLEDEQCLEDIANRDESLQQVFAQRIDICEKNTKLAQTNLELKPELQKEKDKLISLVDRFNNTKIQLDQYYKTYDKYQDKYVPENVKKQLLNKIKTYEKKCESCSTKYYRGELDTEDFAAEFMNIRQELQNYKILLNRIKLNLNS